MVTKRTTVSTEDFNGHRVIAPNQPRRGGKGNNLALRVSGVRYNFASGMHVPGQSKATYHNLTAQYVNGLPGSPNALLLSKSGAGNLTRYVEWNNGIASPYPHLFSLYAKNVGNVPASLFLDVVELGVNSSGGYIGLTETADYFKIANNNAYIGVECLDDGWYKFYTSIEVQGTQSFLCRFGFMNTDYTNNLTTLDSAQILVSGFSLEQGYYPKPHNHDGQIGITTPADEYVLPLKSPTQEFTVAVKLSAKSLKGLQILCKTAQDTLGSGLTFTNNLSEIGKCDYIISHNGEHHSNYVRTENMNTEQTIVFSYSPDPLKRKIVCKEGVFNGYGGMLEQAVFDKLVIAVTSGISSGVVDINNLFLWPKAFSEQTLKNIYSMF